MFGFFALSLAQENYICHILALSCAPSSLYWLGIFFLHPLCLAREWCAGFELVAARRVKVASSVTWTTAENFSCFICILFGSYICFPLTQRAAAVIKGQTDINENSLQVPVVKMKTQTRDELKIIWCHSYLRKNHLGACSEIKKCYDYMRVKYTFVIGN